MDRNIRFFLMGGQWNVVHVPEKPNGFGVLIIGDTNHFVDEYKSLWTQHIGRIKIMEQLLNAGYTVFYSNLFGTNWGSEKALEHSQQLYHVILKQEILNSKIHILAEGMGALVAIQLMETMKEDIRSVALINPCLDLHAHYKLEKEKKFFFKKLMKELLESHNVTKEELENKIKHISGRNYASDIPVKVWQTTTNFTYNPNVHCKIYEEWRKKQLSPILVTYHLMEKRYTYGNAICQFFAKFESKL